jgi:peroxiredoxin family protein
MSNIATSSARSRSSASHGGLDEAYPSLILANAARQSGIEAFVFFTFWGLDIITESKVDHLHVNLAGNASSGMPTMLAGLPGMESLAAKMMKKQMEELELPTVREMLQILDEVGRRALRVRAGHEDVQAREEGPLPQVKDVITAGDFYDLAEGAQIIFT